MLINKTIMYQMRQIRQATQSYYRTLEQQREAAWMICVCLLLAAVIIFWASLANAQLQLAISEETACHCILGEARGEYLKYGYNAFLGIAEVLRHRGSTQGIYGCNASFWKELPYLEAKGLILAAEKAWAESEHTNITKNATHFESVMFKKPYWAKDMVQVAKIGNHVFYKEKL